jgi:predicted RNA-binding protein with PIN domain
MHYILDGYNIIHKTPAFEALLSRSLEEARRGLIGFCKTLLQARGDIVRITVVFDGQSDVFSPDGSTGRLEIIYTITGEDADDRIVDYLRQTQPRFASIVSDDNYVCNSARAFKVKAVSVADFLGTMRKTTSHAKKRSLKNNPTGKHIGAKQRDDITQSYADYLGLSES